MSSQHPRSSVHPYFVTSYELLPILNLNSDYIKEFPHKQQFFTLIDAFHTITNKITKVNQTQDFLTSRIPGPAASRTLW